MTRAQVLYDAIHKQQAKQDELIIANVEDNQLSLHHDLHTFLSKLDPDLCYYSGIRYKSELDDCGVSVDGHTKGNGWKLRISWDNDTTVLWSPNLKALLNGALDFLKERVTP
ncbi:MAG: hypothetical protein ACK5U6_17230 [Pseudanabaena sp.]|jgi:hypothetical protein